MYRYILLLTCFLLSYSPIYASNQICDEDFEDVTVGCIPQNDPTSSGEISSVSRTMHMDCSSCVGGEGTGCDTPVNGTIAGFIDTGCSGGNGKCARVYVYGTGIGGDAYSEPKFRFDNKIGGSEEVYIKFDIKMDANLPTSEYENLKLIHITDEATAVTPPGGRWDPELNFNPGSGYSWYTWSDGDCDAEYYFTRASTKINNSLTDFDWHTYEIYVHVGSAVVENKDDASADGIVRIWEDNVLILEDISVPMRCSGEEGNAINSVAFIRHIKDLGSNAGNIYFDNIEVWDGMPDEESSSDSIATGITPSGITFQ
jgi:hypothetical protein